MGAPCGLTVARPLRREAQPVRVLQRHQRLGRHRSSSRRSAASTTSSTTRSSTPTSRTTRVPRYAFITPNLDNDMHDGSIADGDAWLARELPEDHGDRRVQERRRDLPDVGRRRRHAGDGRSAVHRDLAERAAPACSLADRLRHQLVPEDGADDPRRRAAAVRSPRRTAGRRRWTTCSRCRSVAGAASDARRAGCGSRAGGRLLAATATAGSRLGKRAVQLDPMLSNPAGQACADCHAPSAAFRDPESDHSSSMGVVPGRFGSRNAPTRDVRAVHAAAALRPDAGAAGPAACSGTAARRRWRHQAAVPMMNPLEMNNPDKATRGRGGAQVALCGDDARGVRRRRARRRRPPAFAHILEAIAAFERTRAVLAVLLEVRPLPRGQGDADRGRAARPGAVRGPGARQLRELSPEPAGPDGSPPLFTNFGYANLGIPRYANNNFFDQPAALNPDGAAYRDHGLADGGRPGAGRQVPRADAAQHRAHRAVRPQRLLREPAILHRLPEHARRRLDLGRHVQPLAAAPNARVRGPRPELAATLDHHVGRLAPFGARRRRSGRVPRHADRQRRRQAQ